MCSLPLNHIPRCLLHKDTLIQITIEEGVGHIKLMNRPSLIHHQRENNMYQLKADHRGKGLLVVNPVGLREPTRT